jgi:hypothetical protein
MIKKTLLFKKNDLVKEEMERLLREMKEMEVDSENYKSAVKNLEILYNMKNSCKNKRSSDAWIVGGIAIAQTILILYFEETNVVRSKAMSFILKGRV